MFASLQNLLQIQSQLVNIPNCITLFRLILTAVFIISVSQGTHTCSIIALVTFILAAASDWLDGYLARKMNLVTSLGKLLDPLADKILVSAGFIYLSSIELCPVWVTCTIIAREFMVTGLRQIAVEKGVVMAADRLGKWKTTLQLVFIIACLVHITLSYGHSSWLSWLNTLSEPEHLIVPISLWIATILTVLSGFNYLWSARHLLSDSPSS